MIVPNLVKMGYKSISGTTDQVVPEIQIKKVCSDYMRLKLILPVVKPDEFEQPKRCRNPKCSGKRFIPFQEVKKNLRDTVHQEVTARRYKCVRCGQTFRVYPQGVQAGQVSQRVKGMAVMLYLLGLSYGAVALMLEALGVYLGKTSVYRSVQATAEHVPGVKRSEIRLPDKDYNHEE